MTRKHQYIIISALAIIGISVGILTLLKNPQEKIDISQIGNKPSIIENQDSLSVLRETGDWYFSDAQGARYVFPSKDILKTWFNNTDIEVPQKTIAEMEKTPLKGQVSVRPGTIVTTESDPRLYIAIGGKVLRIVSSQDVRELYGEDSADFSIQLPNYFFTSYVIEGEFTKEDVRSILAKQSLEENLITR